MTAPPAPAQAQALRLLIAGGGTGGHVYPALAVAEQLLAESPDSALQFVGAEGGLEGKLVPAHGYPIALLRVGRLKGASTLARARTLLGLAPAIARALRIVRSFAPDIVVGVGGYASGPVTLAARALRRPVVLLEQNAIPGLTNRVMARLAHRVVLSFDDSARYLPASVDAVVLGNPMRAALVRALEASGGRASEPGEHERDTAVDDAVTLLVVGGSQGARRINEVFVDALPRLLERLPALRVIHQTGPREHDAVLQRYREHGEQASERVRCVPYLEDMPVAYGKADVVLGRAGATTVAELAIAGLPAVLVPYPFAADDHQTANARVLADVGAARLVPQDQLDAARLVDELSALLADAALRQRMSTAARSVARPRAAADVVALLRTLAREHR